MGAYRLGDIAELCELVQPRIGVLTAIGRRHLERIGSLDAIEQAKGELAVGLPADGTYVTTADDERCLRTTERTRRTCVLFSAAGSPKARTCRAHDIEMAEGTTRFTLRHGAERGHGPLQAARPPQRRQPARRRRGRGSASTCRSTQSAARSPG